MEILQDSLTSPIPMGMVHYAFRAALSGDILVVVDLMDRIRSEVFGPSLVAPVKRDLISRDLLCHIRTEGLF